MKSLLDNSLQADHAGNIDLGRLISWRHGLQNETQGNHFNFCWSVVDWPGSDLVWKAQTGSEGPFLLGAGGGRQGLVWGSGAEQAGGAILSWARLDSHQPHEIHGPRAGA